MVSVQDATQMFGISVRYDLLILIQCGLRYLFECNQNGAAVRSELIINGLVPHNEKLVLLLCSALSTGGHLYQQCGVAPTVHVKDVCSTTIGGEEFRG